MPTYKLLMLLIAALCISQVSAQDTEPPKNEFRGAWIATVINLDWPSSGSLSPRFQKSDLINKLDVLNESGINIVYFQIRTEGDALYDSDIEPWSKYLTGEEGVAPDPYWDPLEFAVEEAHKRGMELHAWLNPYRAMRAIPDDFTQKTAPKTSSDDQVDESLKPFLGKDFDINSKFKNSGTSERDSMHVSNKHPEWLLVLNDAIAIFDPGLPEVMEYNVDIVMDVVNRYDIDGIHFDDYFYPYPPNHMGSSSENNALDDSTFIKFPRGFTNKGDWRRNNIDIYVEMLHDSIQVVKPWIKFGISPFGIWKNGVPSGTGGMDAYSVIYGDALAWLEAQTIDYITPQLYWAITRFYSTGQDYRALADWWANHAEANDRHIYPGHGVYRTSSSTYSGPLFDADEIPRQIQHNRDHEYITGSVFFRTKNITNYSSKGFKDSLQTNYYRYAALQPTMHWKDTTQPGTPQNLVASKGEYDHYIDLSWDRPVDDGLAKQNSDAHLDTLLKYAIYRVDSATQPNEAEAMEVSANLIAVTGETSYTDIAPSSQDNYYYFVTAASRNNVESEPTESANVGVVVSNEEEIFAAKDFKLSQNYPNPFNPTTEINFQLKNTNVATLKVYDMIGREVATLVNQKLNAGTHTYSFDASALSSGIYIYQLTVGDESDTKKMTLIK